MQNSSLLAVENAELEAEQMIIMANNESIQIIHDAKEEVKKKQREIINQAEFNAAAKIADARKLSEKTKTTKQSEVQSELLLLKEKFAKNSKTTQNKILTIWSD